MPSLKGFENALWFSHLSSSHSLEPLWELLLRIFSVGRSLLCPRHLDMEIPCVLFHTQGEGPQMPEGLVSNKPVFER